MTRFQVEPITPSTGTASAEPARTRIRDVALAVALVAVVAGSLLFLASSSGAARAQHPAADDVAVLGD